MDNQKSLNYFTKVLGWNINQRYWIAKLYIRIQTYSKSCIKRMERWKRKEKKKKRHESMAPPTLGVTKIKLFIRVIPKLGVAVEYWVSDTNMHHWTRYVRAWTYAYIITHKVSYICHQPTRIITYFQSMRINIGRFVPAKESLLSLCHRKLLSTRHYLLWIIVHLSSLDINITLTSSSRQT